MRELLNCNESQDINANSEQSKDLLKQTKKFRSTKTNQ